MRTGRPNSHKLFVEDCGQLDIRGLSLPAGSWSQLPGRPPSATITLSWLGKVKRYHVSLDMTPCHFGGHRLWYRCPRCGRRRRKLLGWEDQLGCRECFKAVYLSQWKW